MRYMIRELRNATGMTQREFAKHYGIPVSSLRKWEQGESSPPSYVISLIARTIPSTNKSLHTFTNEKGDKYYYDETIGAVYDAYGNQVFISAELHDVKEQNLLIYLEELFDGFHKLQDKFNRDCLLDAEEDILWTT